MLARICETGTSNKRNSIKMVPGVTVIFVTTCSTKFVLYSLELEDCTTVILQDQNFDNSVAEWIIVLDISC